MKRTSEAAFETAIESVLLGEGYTRVDGKGFDRERAIFPDESLAFIQTTQAKVWEKLEALHGEQTGARVGITVQVAGHPRHVGHVAAWLQMFWQDLTDRFLPPGARTEPGAGGALPGQSAWADPPIALQPEV